MGRTGRGWKGDESGAGRCNLDEAAIVQDRAQGHILRQIARTH
jgi:hypothetical protein